MKQKNKESVAESPSLNKKRVSIAREVTCEMEERKSIFLGHAKPVSTEEEAKQFIAEKKAEYADATHNVSAYLLNGGAIARFSDDGEPQGTAGSGGSTDPTKDVEHPEYFVADLYLNNEKVANIDLTLQKGEAE